MNDKNSTTTVVMACKTAHGIKMEVGEIGKPGYRTYTLNGANSSRVFGGYGLTPGIPKDFAIKWLQDHEHFPMVVRGHIYIEGDEQSAIAHAKENKDVRTGVEPWNPLVGADGKAVSKDQIDPNYVKQVQENPMRQRSVDLLQA